MRTAGIMLFSLALTCAVIGNAYYQKKQFYPSVVYITKSNPSMAVSFSLQISFFQRFFHPFIQIPWQSRFSLKNTSQNPSKTRKKDVTLLLLINAIDTFNRTILIIKFLFFIAGYLCARTADCFYYEYIFEENFLWQLEGRWTWGKPNDQMLTFDWLKKAHDSMNMLRIIDVGYNLPIIFNLT